MTTIDQEVASKKRIVIEVSSITMKFLNNVFLGLLDILENSEPEVVEELLKEYYVEPPLYGIIVDDLKKLKEVFSD